MSRTPRINSAIARQMPKERRREMAQVFLTLILFPHFDLCHLWNGENYVHSVQHAGSRVFNGEMHLLAALFICIIWIISNIGLMLRIQSPCNSMSNSRKQNAYVTSQKEFHLKWDVRGTMLQNNSQSYAICISFVLDSPGILKGFTNNVIFHCVNTALNCFICKIMLWQQHFDLVFVSVQIS